MQVSTSRLLSALAAVIVLAGGYVASTFAKDPELVRVILSATAIVEGLLIPAAAAPVGTVDALGNQRAKDDAAGRTFGSG